MQMSCGVCNLEYDFILKQETAMKENDWLIKIMGFGQTKLCVEIVNTIIFLFKFSISINKY